MNVEFDILEDFLESLSFLAFLLLLAISCRSELHPRCDAAAFFGQDLEPFIQPLMEKLGAKLQSNDVKVQKKVSVSACHANGRGRTGRLGRLVDDRFLFSGFHVKCGVFTSKDSN